jgi:hypothetical protein
MRHYLSIDDSFCETCPDLLLELNAVPFDELHE